MNPIRNYRGARLFVCGLILALNLSDLPKAGAAASYSYIDLNPSGFYNDYGHGISGSHQVGQGIPISSPQYSHALMWSGRAATAVDLNPVGFTQSSAYGMSGNQQVGYGYGSASGNITHALLWSGTAASAVDLHPAGYRDSYAYAISGSQQ